MAWARSDLHGMLAELHENKTSKKSSGNLSGSSGRSEKHNINRTIKHNNQLEYQKMMICISTLEDGFNCHAHIKILLHTKTKKI